MHICARFTHVQILNSIYSPLYTPSWRDSAVCCLATCASSCPRSGCTLCSSRMSHFSATSSSSLHHLSHTEISYLVSYCTIPYPTRPDKCNRAAKLKQRASSALDIPPRLHSAPQSQFAVPSSDLESPHWWWPHSIAMAFRFGSSSTCCCCCLRRKK